LQRRSRMRVPAAVAGLPLLIGVVAGLIAFDRGAVDVGMLAAAGALLALLSAAGAFGIGAHPEATIAIVAGCGLAGASLGVSSAGRTYRPSLLRWFESRRPGEAYTPISIEGVLREDASLSGAGPSLVVDARRVAEAGMLLSVRGGVRLTVAGVFGPARLEEWRAGRTVKITALLRLPSTYFDPGVRDDRRALARRSQD